MSLVVLRAKLNQAKELSVGKAFHLLNEALDMIDDMMSTPASSNVVSVRDIVIEMFSSVAIYDFRETDLDTTIGMFMDSLDLVEAIMAVEDTLAIELDDAELEHCSTLRDFIKVVEDHQNV